MSENFRSGPSLRLFQPDLFPPDRDGLPDLGPSTRDLSPLMPLSRFVREFLIPSVLEGTVEAETVADYELVIDTWVEFTGDPPLAEIGPEHKAAWRKGCAQKPGRKKGTKFSHASLKKYARILNACFLPTGPYSAHCEHAQELLARAPRISSKEIPGTPADPKECFERPEIEALLSACHTASIRWPKVDGVLIGDWWEARILAAYYTGERRNAMHQVRYADLKGDQLTFRAATRKRKARSLPVFLLPEALEAIERIRTPRELIFEFRTYGRNQAYHWPRNAGTFEDMFRLICRASGLPESRQFGIHGVRRSLATALTEAGHSWEAQQALGHSDDTTTNRYRDRAKLVAKAIADIPRLKLPTRPPVVRHA